MDFAIVKPFDTSACGRAFGIGGTVLISKIETDISFASNKVEGMKAGFKAVKSVPVFGTNNRCVGIVSTHFKEVKRNWDTQALDVLLSEIALELEKLQNSNSAGYNFLREAM